nr:transposase [Chromatiaceae bacterium]
MSHCRPIHRDVDFLLPPSVQEWLPEGHLARYVVEVVEGLDLSALERAYAGRGSLSDHPAMVLSLLIDGYATGGYSSRKIERATYDALAFRFIAANHHPDHDTLATFRRRFAPEFQATCVQVLQVAREHQLSRCGTVSLDGTQIHANASRHNALSSGHAEAIEAQLQGEVQQLLALAAEADGVNIPDGRSVPDELKRREDRLAAIAAAKVKIAARAAERLAREQADYEAQRAARAAKAAASGHQPRGKPPTAPTPGPRPEDQINLTDEESRIMPVAGGGFEPCYNAQAVVDTETLLVRVPQITQAANDQQQVAPMRDQRQALPATINQAEQLLAAAGSCSEANVTACESAGSEPSIAIKRDEHYPHGSERCENPPAPRAAATPVERMAHRLKTPKGRATYALRKQTVEPVFSIIKAVMGFRQFLTRGLDNVQ